MKKELLAPAGDLTRLKTAIIYGADAVYFGGKQFSLRARASNFTISDIAEAVQFAHSYGRKVYVTVNIIPHNSDFEGLEEYLKILSELGVDAIICASAAILELSKWVAPQMEVHISTQQTTLNSQAISYWRSKGADRIVLGREVTLRQIEQLAKNTDMPLEVFIHGGMCANYSGRCTISNALTNRDANRGGCAHSCRWNYHLYQGDQCRDRDDYLFSMGSRDMNTSPIMEKLLKTEAISFKIEGRMKTAFYIAGVVKGYRYLIDCYQSQGFISEEQYRTGMDLVSLVENRESFTGFYEGFEGKKGQLYSIHNSTASQNFVANVVSYDDASSLAIVEVRNHFEKGDVLSVLNPLGFAADFPAQMWDLDGNEVTVANRPLQLLKLKVPVEVNEYSFVYAPEVGK